MDTQCRRTRNESYDRGSWNGSSPSGNVCSIVCPSGYRGSAFGKESGRNGRSLFHYADATGSSGSNSSNYGAKNAAILAAKILAASDDSLLQKLKDYTTGQKEAVKAKAAKLDEVGYEAYLASK